MGASATEGAAPRAAAAGDAGGGRATLEELEARAGLRRLPAEVAPQLEVQLPAQHRAREARREGRVCGACGGPLPVDRAEPFWMAGLSPNYHGGGPRWSRWLAPVCRACAPPELLARQGRAVRCDGCGRPPVRGWDVAGGSRLWCSGSCRHAFYDRRRRSRRDARDARSRKACPVCGRVFDGTRRDAVTCSPACRQRAYRQRRRAQRGAGQADNGQEDRR
jgi:hypothetical protein